MRRSNDARSERSVADIQRTLSLEPRHFGAISGMGLIFLERGDPRGALDAFEAVLVVHPHAAGARARVASRSPKPIRTLWRFLKS